MKNAILFISLITGLASCNTTDQNKLKRYDIKSGVVEYTTTVSGKVMGSAVNGSGTEKLFFKDWGALELKETELNQTTTVNFFGRGKTETENTHTIVKLDNGKSYAVDFNKKQIYATRDMAMEMAKAFQPDGDAGEMGENMLKSMGGEKTGKDKILGYDCEIWEIAGGKQWIYNGVMLKAEMIMLGITTLTEAKTAKFNSSVADKYFKLPDFPIHEEESFMDDDDFNIEDIDANMEKLSKLSFGEWKKMVLEGDPEMKKTSDEELRQSYDMMQKMLKLRNGK